MCTSAWPTSLDLSRDECKRILRRLELDAYSTLVSAFRAQGDLNKDKKKMLQDLQNLLSISSERHRAEVRRAVNDEQLLTVADNISARQGSSSEWQVESRRLAPLLPRLVPQTAFTKTANNIANIQAENNLGMPFPSQTAFKEEVVTTPAATPPVAKGPRSTSPNRNVVVLPSGMSIHIKGGSDEEVPQAQPKRRQHASAIDAVTMPKAGAPSVVSSTSRLGASQQFMSPVRKLSAGKSPMKSHIHTATTSSSPSQKVIIVSSNAVGGSTASSVAQRTMPLPVMMSSASQSVTTTTSVIHSRSSIGGPMVSNGNLGNIITVATPASNPSAQTVSGMHAGSYITTARPRAKTITNTRFRSPMPQVINASTRSTPHSMPLPIKATNKPTIHIKQEGSMKIITQGAPGGISGSSKILPRPGPGSPGLLASSAQPTLVTRTLSASQMAASGKVFSVSAGSRLGSGTTQRFGTPNIVTVNPKSLHMATTKGGASASFSSVRSIQASSSGKPNVIVVQKTQGRHSTMTQLGAGSPTTIAVTRHGQGGQIISSPFEKELVSFIQKQDLQKKQIMSQLKTVPGKPVEGQRKSIVVSSKTDAPDSQPGSGRSSLLAELIHAAGISQASASQVTEEITLPKDATENQWVEYDVGPDELGATQEVEVETEPSVGEDASAISALLDLQSGGKVKVGLQDRSAVVDLTESAEPAQQQEIYLIDESGNIIQTSKGSIGPGGVLQALQADGSTVAEQPHIQFVDETGAEVEVEFAPGGDMSQLAGLGQEILGELDPDTGIVYTSMSSPQQAKNTTSVVYTQPSYQSTPTVEQSIVMSSKNTTEVVVVSAGDTIVPSATEVLTATQGEPKTMDFLTSALSEANIDLETYQFLEETQGTTPKPEVPQRMPVKTVPALSTPGSGLVSILNPPGRLATASVSSVTQALPIEQVDRAPREVHSIIVEQPQSIQSKTIPTATVPRQVATQPRPRSSFIPIQDVVKGAGTPTISVTRQPQVLLHRQHMPSSGVIVSSTLGGASSSSSSSGMSGASNVTVAVEPSGLDTAHMKIEDFTSQKFDTDVGLDMDQHGDVLRLSKRKRKAPTNADEVTSPSSIGGWLRLALGLLQRVSRYRGAYKEKGDMNAASWFTHPVDPQEVPDYYQIIKMPMDFNTIKRKLEMNTYHDWDDFHADMMLVKDNCFQYNPEGSEVRRDCIEVFNFYMQEYDKVFLKWQQAQLVASPKKVRLDRSPIR